MDGAVDLQGTWRDNTGQTIQVLGLQGNQKALFSDDSGNSWCVPIEREATRRGFHVHCGKFRLDVADRGKAGRIEAVTWVGTHEGSSSTGNAAVRLWTKVSPSKQLAQKQPQPKVAAAAATSRVASRAVSEQMPWNRIVQSGASPSNPAEPSATIVSKAKAGAKSKPLPKTAATRPAPAKTGAWAGTGGTPPPSEPALVLDQEQQATCILDEWPQISGKREKTKSKP